jgi:hypothetical protein
MKAIARIGDQSKSDRIIDHLKLSFLSKKPPLPAFEQAALMAVGEGAGYS